MRFEWQRVFDVRSGKPLSLEGGNGIMVSFGNLRTVVQTHLKFQIYLISFREARLLKMITIIKVCLFVTQRKNSVQ